MWTNRWFEESFLGSSELFNGSVKEWKANIYEVDHREPIWMRAEQTLRVWRDLQLVAFRLYGCQVNLEWSSDFVSYKWTPYMNLCKGELLLSLFLQELHKLFFLQHTEHKSSRSLLPCQLPRTMMTSQMINARKSVPPSFPLEFLLGSTWALLTQILAYTLEQIG